MLTIVIDVRTNYKNDAYKSLCKETVVKAEKKTYEKLKKTHLNDYTPLFDRVSLQLGTGEYTGLPTDKRWEQVKKGGYDPGLDVLLFQYGRYLLLASSRENSPLPAALQGFFNDNLACNMGWTNDYHLDINTQQNYWIANVGNLAECHLPLFKYIEDLSVHGAKTAQKIYGCKDGQLTPQPIYGDTQLLQEASCGDYFPQQAVGLPRISGLNTNTHVTKII